MNFPIHKSFRDEQDKKRLNKKDDFYPRAGLNPTKVRIKELQEKGFIGEEELKEAASNNEGGQASEPVHVGGGTYELPNGERVKGKDEAFAALKELEARGE